MSRLVASALGVVLAFGAGGCGDAGLGCDLVIAAVPGERRPGAGRRAGPRVAGPRRSRRNSIGRGRASTRATPVSRWCDLVLRRRRPIGSPRSRTPMSVRTSRSPSTAGSRSSRRSWPASPTARSTCRCRTGTRPPRSSEPACKAPSRHARGWRRQRFRPSGSAPLRDDRRWRDPRADRSSMLGFRKTPGHVPASGPWPCPAGPRRARS